MSGRAHSSHKEANVSSTPRSGCRPATLACLWHGLGRALRVLWLSQTAEAVGLHHGAPLHQKVWVSCRHRVVPSWPLSVVSSASQIILERELVPQNAVDSSNDGWGVCCAEPDPAVLCGLGRVRERDSFLQHSAVGAWVHAFKCRRFQENGFLERWVGNFSGGDFFWEASIFFWKAGTSFSGTFF